MARSVWIRVAWTVLAWMLALGATSQLDPQLRPRALWRIIAPQAPAARPLKHEENVFQPWEHVST